MADAAHEAGWIFRFEGEGFHEFRNRFEQYWVLPLKFAGEADDAYRRRCLKHDLTVGDLWQAALTPADQDIIIEELVAAQIKEDADEAAWLLSNPQPEMTPEQLLESEARSLRDRAALAALDFDQLERDGWPNLGGLAER